jgi:hypothetical protein
MKWPLRPGHIKPLFTPTYPYGIPFRLDGGPISAEGSRAMTQTAAFYYYFGTARAETD